jgi:nucleoside-diphosphate-sugar epimerase
MFLAKNPTQMTIGLSGQKIVVTGANGFIGAHLCRRLSAQGAEVHAVYRTLRPANLDVQRWWQADLANLDQVKQIIDGAKPDVIFHLASHVKGAPDLEHVLPTFHSNLESTVNILTVATQSNCRRVILTGSLAEPDFENGEMFPVAPYAAAKWASSGYARMFHALYKTPVVIARVFMVYGPAQVDLTKLIPYATLSMLLGKRPKISSGGRLVDWIYVSDVVDGFLALAETPGIDGATFDLGSGSLVSIRDLLVELSGVIGDGASPDFGALADRPLEPTRIAKVAESLAKIGWKPQVSLQEGLRHTVEWYRGDLEKSPELYSDFR